MDSKLTFSAGLQAHRAGRLAEAAQAYQSVLAMAPDDIAANHYFGVVLLQSGQAEKAIPFLEKAAKSDRHADYHNRLGLAYAALDRSDAAIESYRSALVVEPSHAESWNNLGIILAETSSIDEAVECYRHAITAKPDFVEAYNNQGVALMKCGKLDEAETSFKTALRYRPGYGEALSNLGNLYLEKRLYLEAVAAYKKGLEQNPEFVDGRVNLANCYARLGYFDKAYDAAKSVTTEVPNRPDGWMILAIGARHLGHFDEALRALDSAAAANATPSEVLANRAVLLLDMGDLAGALSYARKAADEAPDNPELRMNLGVIQLLQGDFEAGFEAYDARWSTRDGHFRDPGFPQTKWRGESLSGKTIMVWREQGVGEEVMFSSILPELEEQAAGLIIASDPRLVPIYRRSFPEARVVPRNESADDVTRATSIDFQSSIGDACRYCRPNAGRFPTPKTYLFADPEQVADLRRTYDSRWPDRPRIGIAWRSAGANPGFSASKSSALSDWAPILQSGDFKFFDLQHGDTGPDRQIISDMIGIDIIKDPDIDQATDLDAFAAQIMALDGVVTTSNTTAHLAGALGQRVVVLLPHMPDWRWQIDRDDSLWYPRVELLRQKRPNVWGDILHEAGQRLASGWPY